MITGVPREAGTTVVTLRANSNPDDGAQAATKSCSITVNPTVMQLTSGCVLPPATAWSAVLTDARLSMVVSPPTAGAAIEPASGGTRVEPRWCSFRLSWFEWRNVHVRVQDSRGTVSDQTCTLPVHAPVISAPRPVRFRREHRSTVFVSNERVRRHSPI